MSIDSARAFAKRLNCVSPTTCQLYRLCDHCRGIDAGRHIDVLEFEVGIAFEEDLAELYESITVPPTSAAYKVYIVTDVAPLSDERRHSLIESFSSAPWTTKLVIASEVPG